MGNMDRIIAEVEQAARENYERSIGRFAQIYDRRLLKDMGIFLSLVAEFDYSEDGCKLVIAKIEVKLENLRKNPRHWSIGIDPSILTAELEGALYVEKRNLRNARMAEGIPQILIGPDAG